MNNKESGFTLLELIIAVGLAAILVTIATAAYVGYQRSTETVDALATVSIMRERFAIARSQNSEQLVVCDESLVRPGDLKNDFMAVSIAALPLDEADLTAGFGAAVTVSATVDKDGMTGIEATKSLHDELVGQGAEVRGAVLSDSIVSFSVLVTSKTQPYCDSGASISALASQQSKPTPTQVAIAPPTATLTLSAQQDVFNTGSDGRALVEKLDTGGDMDALTLEFSVVGKEGGSATASTGPVIFNYGTNSNNNLVSAWRPSNFTIAIQGKDYASGIDLTDGKSHRVTTSWDSATGSLNVFDNGVLAKSFDNVSPGAALAGNGYLVLGQKMNNPATQSGWNAGEHYSGQIFGASLATEVFSDTQIAAAPLYAHAKNLVADIRSQGGTMSDVTGRHSVQVQGSPVISKVDVNTDLALIPPGSAVKVSASAKSGGGDYQVSSMMLSGLGTLTISDTAGHTGTGRVNITNWDTDSLSIALPAGFSQNVTLQLVVVATSAKGAALIGNASTELRMASLPTP